jgi:hypothetical protein
MATNDVPVPVPDALKGHPIVPATDFLRVTEQAALASARWVGQGNAHAADGAAVDAMRKEFGAMPITGEVIIGEGEKDEAPELYVGEVLGTGGMPCEIAVDPLEGTDLVARGDAGAVEEDLVGEMPGREPIEMMPESAEYEQTQQGMQ